MEKIAGFAVTLATRIQRAPNGSALPRSHSSELPTQPKAFAPKTRWLRHPLTEKRAGLQEHVSHRTVLNIVEAAHGHFHDDENGRHAKTVRTCVYEWETLYTV